MSRSFITSVLLFIPLAVSAQQSEFLGEWLLWLESDNRMGRPAYGSLVFEQDGDDLAIYIDGGPVNLLSLDGNRIRFDFDWTDLPDRVHISILDGELNDGVIEGRATEDGEDRGIWRATRVERRQTPLPPDPVDFSGIWGPSAILSKDSFDLTAVGREADELYDPTIDDPILRCVSDGLIRMSHGPFHIEIIAREDRTIVLHEDLHEVRRIYTDGREFPEGIEDAWLAMGYSIGHWEGSTFVIETRGLKKTVWDASGMPISVAAVVTERWSFDDEGQMHIEFSLDDPVNYNRPVMMHQARQRQPDDTYISEYSCDPHPFYRSLLLEGRLEEYWGRSQNRL
ncbi:MAG: hypothetical protein ACJ0SL_06825 [Candidatus Rariloculaceae bacterium]